MKSLLLNLLKKVYLDEFATTTWKKLRQTAHRILWHRKRGFGRVDQVLIKTYLAQHSVRKLQIGAGTNLREGWLNTNFFPWRADILHLDAVKPFPFEDNTFDYIFSEHMIEHIDYHQGLSMLSECFRILRPNGRIRLSTPDFQFLINLYTQPHTLIQEEYLSWMADWMNERKSGSVPDANPIFVINNFVRDWGHQFIYDEKSLRLSLEKVGFSGVCRYELQESGVKDLKSLENEQRYPTGFLRLETITLEATK